MHHRGNVGVSFAICRAPDFLLKKGTPPHAKPIILIDEYDMPVTKASVNGYLKEMTAFMRQFLSGAMKNNVHSRISLASSSR